MTRERDKEYVARLRRGDERRRGVDIRPGRGFIDTLECMRGILESIGYKVTIGKKENWTDWTCTLRIVYVRRGYKIPVRV